MNRIRRFALVLVVLATAATAQTISSISPNDACFNGPSFTLTVNGSNFIYAGGVGNSSAVRWNGTNLPTTAVSSSQLTATVAASFLATPGAAAITVFNQHLIGPPTTSNTVTFTVNTFAEIDHVGTSVFCADGTSATIEVFSTTNLSGYSVRWNSTTISSSNYGYYGNGLYYRHASVPASMLNLQGIASVRLRSPDGCDSSPVTVTMQAPPAITSISPSSKPQGSVTFTLTVNGSSFQPNHVVRWDGLPLPTTYGTAAQLTATVDESFLGRLGSATISVVGGPCGSASGSQTFSVIGPVITSVSPTAIGVNASTVTLTVNGTGMSANTGVLFEGTVLTTTFVSSTQVTAVVPGNLLATAGTKAVSLRHAYFGFPTQYAFSDSKAFTVQGPTLQRLSPGHTPAGGAQFTVTLRGTSLNSGSFVPTLVRWNGVNHIPTYVDPSTLQLTVTAAMIASAGTATVDVIVPLASGGSRTTNALTFTIDPPGISNVASGWTVDAGGYLSDAVVANNKLYVGGYFNFVGPLTGPAAILSTVYGAMQDAAPAVNGTVNSVVADGSGGWYLGGSFTAVGIFPRGNLAHVWSNGLVDPYFTAQTNGPVYSISVSLAGNLQVGGDFSRLNFAPRHNIGGVSGTTSELTAFNPCANGPVTSISAEGTWTIAVGSFTNVAWSAAPVTGLAALWVTNGDLYPWDFNGGSGPADPPVVVRAEGSTVYLGTTTHLESRSIFDGSLVGWSQVSVTGGAIRDIDITPSLVFIGGGFTSVNGTARGHVAAIDKSTGGLQSFDPGANGDVFSIDADGEYLYAGGQFTQFAGVAQRRCGSVLFNFGTPGYFQPNAENGDVTNVVVSGSLVGVFGTFNSVGGAARKNLAAIDLATGTVIPTWQADTSGGSGVVTQLSTDTNWLYVGGIFTTLDGQPRNRLGRVGLVSGNVDGWNPSPNSQVDAIVAGPSSVFVAGFFTTIGGASRYQLAEVDLVMGAATAFDPGGFSGQAHCMALAGSTLYLGGYIGLIGGLTRSNIGAIDLTTGAVLPFAPVLNGWCESIAVDGNTVFLGGGFTTVDGVARQRLAAVRAGDGELLALNASVDGTILSMARSGATMFLGGNFNQVGGQPHAKAAAIDLGTLQPRPWAPSVSGTINAVRLGTNQVIVGGNLTAGGLTGIPAYALGGTFATPVLSSLGTQSALAGSGSFTLSLQGSGFATGSAARFGGLWVPTAFVSASQLQATIDAALLVDAGVVSVDVIAPAPGAGVSAALSFTINNPAPVASSLGPPTAPYNGAPFTLTVFGSGFSSQSVVRWNGAALPTTPVSASEVHASVATGLLGTAGPVSITVFNPAPGGGTSGALSFTVEFPTPGATSLVPASQLAGSGSFALVVNGGPFYAGSVVRWDGVPLSTTFVNGSQLSAQVSAGLLLQAGAHAVDVSTPPPGGGVSGALTFSVLNPLPQCSSLSPSSANAGSPGFTLQVTGSAFVSTSVVRWNATPLPTSFVSATSLQATVAASLLAAGGTIAVDVTSPSPGGGTSGSQPFGVVNPVPAASALSPPTVTAGGPTFALTVTGSGFNASSVVLAGGAPVPTTFTDAMHVSAQIDASLILSGGTLAIAVSNPAPGGGASATLSLAIQNPVPVLTQIGPASVPAGGPAFQLAVTGSGFVPASTVTWSGLPLPTSFTSQTQLQATVGPLLTAFGGSASVAVVNPVPGGGPSNALLFSVVAPVVTALSPNSVALMQPSDPPLVVTVSGSGFSPAAAVYAGELALSTFYSSSSQLFTTVPSSLIQTQFPSALVISVLDGTAHSNGLPLRFGSGLNQGWIMKSPPNPAPGQPFSLVLEGGIPSASFSLFYDVGAIPPITPFPTVTANEVLAINPASPTLAILFDGLGIAGPPQPFAFSPLPQGPAPGGRFALQGLVAPSPPLGAVLSLQAAFPAPTSWNLHLTWGVLMTF